MARSTGHGYAEVQALRSDSTVIYQALTVTAIHGKSGLLTGFHCHRYDRTRVKPVERDDLLASTVKFAKPPAKPSEALPRSIASRRPAFLENRRLDLSRMRSALSTGDFATIQHIGHNCKGIGTGYGFPEISIAGSNLECAARALDFIEVEKSIGAFEKCIPGA
jgi:hypothetical protein